MKALFFVVAFLFSGVVQATQSFDGNKAESIVQEYIEKQEFSGTVLIAQNGKVQFRKAYGLSSRTLKTENKILTRYPIASVSKQFTATAIMLLVEAGKLKVEQKLTDFFPHSPKVWGNITVHHLLTHSAGFTSEPKEVDSTKFHTLEQLVETFKLTKLQFKAGTNYMYSNAGYTILARIVEVVSGEGFVDFLVKHIFEPNGMTNTGMYHAAAVIPNLASGYLHTEDGTLINVCCYDVSNYNGASNIYTTVDDLLKWDRVLTSGKFLSAQSSQEMWTPWNTMKDDKGNDLPSHYGYGWVIDQIDGQDVIWHNGSQMGYSSAFFRYKNGRTIIILSNMWKVNAYEMAKKLGAI